MRGRHCLDVATVVVVVASGGEVIEARGRRG